MSDIQIQCMVLGAVQTNCYIIENTALHRALVIDPADNAEAITKVLKEAEMELEAILLTHGHFDHGLAAPALSSAMRAQVYANEAEAPLLADPHMTASFMVGREFAMEPDVLVRDGQELQLAGVRIQVIHTPGHTAGGTCYYLPEYGILFAGDTLFAGSVGRTDLPTGNGPRLIASIKEKLLVLPGETLVLPGHGGQTTIENESKFNPYLDESGFWE